MPTCVLCERKRRLWNGRGAATRAEAARPAAYLVHVGRSQVERFECVECQAETGNRIVVTLATA